MIDCYWHNIHYSRILSNSIEDFEDIYLDSHKYPLFVTTHSRNFKHFSSPPGFLSPSTQSHFIDQCKDLLTLSLDKKPLTAYLQYRDNKIEEIECFLKKNNIYYNINERFLVILDLESETSMLAKTKRDTRSRLNKILRHKYKTKIKYDSIFSEHYSDIAERNKFSLIYKYKNSDLENISRLNNIIPISIYDETGSYIGGSILGRVNNTICDYILSAYNLNYENSGRIILWHSVIKAKELGFKKINLGGGIKNNDSLESFKLSFGGKLKEFYIFKVIFNRKHFSNIYNMPFTSVIYEGRFPPS